MLSIDSNFQFLSRGAKITGFYVDQKFGMAPISQIKAPKKFNLKSLNFEFLALNFEVKIS